MVHSLNKNLPLWTLKILLIDDEQDFNERFKALIAPYGHTVIYTMQPGEAIKLVNESYNEMNPFDAVFVDYLMPGLNGVETAREFKKIDPELVLIALTRDATIETKVLIVKSMVFDLYFVKSNTSDKIEKIMACLESTKMEQYSGNQSGLSKKLKVDQQRAKEKPAKEETAG